MLKHVILYCSLLDQLQFTDVNYAQFTRNSPNLGTFECSQNVTPLLTVTLSNVGFSYLLHYYLSKPLSCIYA